MHQGVILELQRRRNRGIIIEAHSLFKDAIDTEWRTVHDMATDDTLRKRQFSLGRIADSRTAPVGHKDPVNQETQENGDN